MSQNSVYNGVIVLLMIGIITVAWQVTSSQQPSLELPISEPSPAVTIAQNSAQPVEPAQLPVNPATQPAPVSSLPAQEKPLVAVQPVETPSPTQTMASEQKNDAQTDAVIIISDFDIEPKQTSIRIGQTVSWQYPSGSNKHAIGFKNSGPRSPLLMQGDSWQHTFNESGVFEYVDLVFTFMYGKVVVG